jgi:hypothetical protein
MGMKYQTTWQDHVRHLSNVCFVCSYLFFERGMVIPGACCTLLGETLLAPSAIKQKAWSTVAIGSVFFFLAIGTLFHGTMGA